MYSSVLSLPARRSAAAIGASVALAAGALVLAPTAQATTANGSGGSGSGHSTAAVLNTGLDVSLLDKAVSLPLNVALNNVHAPADANETTLSARLDGVDDGKPFHVLTADVATARATADTRRAEGYSNLVRAKVDLPGLPESGLLQVQQVTSQATCEAGKAPTAHSNVLGDVVVLGKKVTLSAGGTTKVDVPGVGEVRLDLSQKQTTSSSAAATALDLKVSVNPAQLNVAQVTGDVTLARATCETPGSDGSSSGSGSTNAGAGNGGASNGASNAGAGSGSSGAANSGASGGKTAGATAQGTGSASSGAGAHTESTGAKSNLAETGADSSTPYLAAGAFALVAGGSGVVYVTRRRRSARGQG